jgi:hypothetical protein
MFSKLNEITTEVIGNNLNKFGFDDIFYINNAIELITATGNK